MWGGPGGAWGGGTTRKASRAETMRPVACVPPNARGSEGRDGFTTRLMSGRRDEGMRVDLRLGGGWRAAL